MKFAFVILIAFALIGSSALAAESAASPAQILDQQREIRSGLDAGTFDLDRHDRMLFGEQDPSGAHS